MRKRPSHTFAVFTAALTLAAAASHASVVWQYEGAGVSSNEWRAARAGSSLMALHGAGNGWAFAEVKQVGKIKTVQFDQGVTAFAFQHDATNRVAVAYAVVRCETAAEMATLLDAPRNVCVRLKSAWNWESTWQWQKEQLGYRAAYRVNGSDTARFDPLPVFQLVEVRFETPPMMRELYVGNAAASPFWQRHWRGDIAELLFLTREPTEHEQHAIYNYIRLKWGIPLTYGKVDTVKILDALGIRRGSLFSTILMVR